MARQDTELVILKAFQRQVFVLIRILKWTLPEVAGFFEDFFEAISVTTGFRPRVPIRQWQGRRDKWVKEWQGRTNDEVLKSIAHYSLWYNGGVDTVIYLPPTSNAACTYHYFKLNLHDNHTEVRKKEVQMGDGGDSSTKESPTMLLTGSYPQPPVQLSTLQSYQENVHPVSSQASARDQRYALMPNGYVDSSMGFWTPDQMFKGGANTTPQHPSTAMSFLPLLEDDETLLSVSSNAKLAARPRGKSP